MLHLRFASHNDSVSEAIHYAYEADKPIVAVTLEEKHSKSNLFDEMTPSMQMMLQSCLDVKWSGSPEPLALAYLHHSLMTAKVLVIQTIFVPQITTFYIRFASYHTSITFPCHRNLLIMHSRGDKRYTYPISTQIIRLSRTIQRTKLLVFILQIVPVTLAFQTLPLLAGSQLVPPSPKGESKRSWFQCWKIFNTFCRRSNNSIDVDLRHTISWHPRHLASPSTVLQDNKENQTDDNASITSNNSYFSAV